MCGQSASDGAERVIPRLAARQHGVVARWQLPRAGVSARQIEWRLRRGQLTQLHRARLLAALRDAR
jgi:hypothetical protein